MRFQSFKTVLALLVCLCGGFAPAFGGSTKAYATADQSEKWCTFKGRIEPGDSESLARAVSLFNCTKMRLDSDGGDVDTAFEMGRVIREKQLTVITTADGQCASACVFLYAAGIVRAPFGEVNIHRPYLPASSASFDQTQQSYRDLEARAKKYLREMNVSEALYDRMMAVPPQGSVSLPLDEQFALGLALRDPVYVEYEHNAKAAKLGISKQEWLLLTNRAVAACGDIEGRVQTSEAPRMKACWDRIFPGFLVSPK